MVKSSRPEFAIILLHALLTEYPVKPHTQLKTDLQGRRQDQGPDHPQRRLHLQALLQRCIQSTRVGASESAYDEYCDSGLRSIPFYYMHY